MNLSRERHEDFNLVLTRYGLERLLYRLGQSEYVADFVLKGAMLFAVWTEEEHRPTKDLDLLGYGDDSGERLTDLFQKICQLEVESDGLIFDASTVRVEEIREDQEYHGQRIRLASYLGKARIPIQIDVAFGDVITPDAEEIEYPTLLDLPSPHIRAYPKESVVSEKLQAMVALGMLNSRMKDFYDIWIISKIFPFDGTNLIRAIKVTFERRKTPIPQTTPVALSDEFSTDREKIVQWRAFLNRNRLADHETDFPLVINELRTFLIPPLQAAATDRSFPQIWTKGGPWSKART
jgi:hypothetical protein